MVFRELVNWNIKKVVCFRKSRELRINVVLRVDYVKYFLGGWRYYFFLNN